MPRKFPISPRAQNVARELRIARATLRLSIPKFAALIESDGTRVTAYENERAAWPEALGKQAIARIIVEAVRHEIALAELRLRLPSIG